SCGGSNRPFWDSSVVQSSGAPAVFDNPTGSPIGCGIYVHPAHTAGFHPGQQDQFSIYRFTTPSTGNYALDATFMVLDPATGGTVRGHRPGFGAPAAGHGRPPDALTRWELYGRH